MAHIKDLEFGCKGCSKVCKYALDLSGDKLTIELKNQDFKFSAQTEGIDVVCKKCNKKIATIGYNELMD